MRPHVYSRTYTIDMVQPSDLSCKYKTASMAPQNSMQLDRPTRRNQRRRSKRIRWIQRILNTPLLSPIWGKGPPASAAVHVSHRQRSNGHPNSTTTICSLSSGYYVAYTARPENQCGGSTTKKKTWRRKACAAVLQAPLASGEPPGTGK